MVHIVLLGFISDIHGNAPALRAVLSALPRVDYLICAGDIVGYYPDVNDVCDLLRTNSVYAVRGNHDAYVIDAIVPEVSRRHAYRTDWTKEHLTADNFSWLQRLPLGLSLQFDEVQVTVRHASPWDEETYLYPDSIKLSQLSISPKTVQVFGHTHYPMWRKISHGYVLNPGSVGQPRDGISSASFAVLDLKAPEARLLRADYDVAQYQRYLRTIGWDELNIQKLTKERRQHA